MKPKSYYRVYNRPSRRAVKGAFVLRAADDKAKASNRPSAFAAAPPPPQRRCRGEGCPNPGHLKVWKRVRSGFETEWACSERCA